MHNTNDSRHYNKDGKSLGSAAGKPSAGRKKPYKKFLGNDKGMAYMSAMFDTFSKSKKQEGKDP